MDIELDEKLQFAFPTGLKGLSEIFGKLSGEKGLECG